MLSKGKFKPFLAAAALLGLLADSPAAEEGRQIYCMAEAIYFEARSESHLGQLAVALTIKNRAFKSPYYPDNICQVVRQGPHRGGVPIRNRCQFSYFCDGIPERIKDRGAWEKALAVAELVLGTEIEIIGMENVTHYHTVAVQPAWSTMFQFTRTIGRHKFYSQKVPL